jgi:L-malate glycosyltransferase
MRFNILLISPRMAIGGEELSTLTISREMIARGHTVYALGGRGPMAAEFEKAGVCVIFTKYPWRSISGVLRQARQIRDVVQKNNIQIVHCQSVLPVISAFLGLKRVMGENRSVKLIFHQRGVHLYTYPVIGILFNFMTDIVVTNSDHERKKMVRCGLKSAKCIRIHNCINLDISGDVNITQEKKKLGISRKDTVLGTVGRLDPIKGIRFLLEAFKKSLAAHPDMTLVIVGDGEERQSLERKAAFLNISDKVVFTGFRRDLNRIFPLFDIFLLCSTFESFGNVALEAAAFGKPVILTDVAGLPETVVDGKTGILIPPRNADSIAQAITHLIQNPQKAQKMGKAGQKRVVEYFSPKRLGDEIEKLYTHLVGKIE